MTKKLTKNEREEMGKICNAIIELADENTLTAIRYTELIKSLLSEGLTVNIIKWLNN